MIQKTKAIVLSSIKYQENSLIAYCYSEDFGRLAVLVNGSRSRSKKQGRSIFFQPFSVLNLVFYQSARSSLHRLKEVEFHTCHRSIPFNHSKRSIAMFLSELVYRTVKEEEANKPLYGFIEDYIDFLDRSTEGIANSHLIFMAQFTHHIGFRPANSWSEQNPYFDYRKGAFVDSQPQHTLYLNHEQSHLLGCILDTPLSAAGSICLDHTQRTLIIDALLGYLKFHLGDALVVNSLPVLISVFE